MLNVRLPRIFLVTFFGVLASSAGIAQRTDRPTRVAVLSFGESETGQRFAETLTRAIASDPNFRVVDRDQTLAAVRGADYHGSLNLNVEDARNLGAVIGCDFFFTGEAQTLRRSSSAVPTYFESYAVIYLVSARTGRLIGWERPAIKTSTPTEAQNDLLKQLANPETLRRYQARMRRSLEDEAAERAHAIESNAPVIEVMTDEITAEQTGTRPPRPYRRVKPVYPEPAAQAEVEATVDAIVDVDEKGEVRRVEIARWAGYGLDQSVLDAVNQLHFFPALRDGNAVPMRVLLRYNFRKPVEK